MRPAAATEADADMAACHCWRLVTACSCSCCLLLPLYGLAQADMRVGCEGVTIPSAAAAAEAEAAFACFWALG